MRIVVLGSLAASLKNFRGPLIGALCERSYEVHAVAPSLSSDIVTHGWLTDREVVCHDVHFSRAGLNAIHDLRALLHLIRLLKRIRPHVFLGYTAKAVIWGLLAARLARVPQRVALITGLGYAFTEGSGGLRTLVRLLAYCLYRQALRCATLIFFQNPDDRADFQRMGLIPPGVTVRLVAGSGIDLDRFPMEPLPPGPIRFLLIARLLADKGIREYVEAARLLRRDWPETELHLVGGVDPNPAGIAEAEVRAWHADGDVIWHGHLEDVRPILAQAHVYVLPSYREGTPRTVLEAMATARAVITTDAPGCRETVVDGENGFLVPVRDAKALAKAMERFLIEPALISRMAAASRLIAEQKYDVHKVNGQMLEAMGL